MARDEDKGSRDAKAIVFISYYHTDSEVADKLSETLRHAGFLIKESTPS